jgi:hypothetical protein
VQGHRDILPQSSALCLDASDGQASARPTWPRSLSRQAAAVLRKRRSASGTHMAVISTHHPTMATTG